MDPFVSVSPQNKVVTDAECVSFGYSFFDLSWRPCFLVRLLLDLEEVVTFNDLKISMVVPAQAHFMDDPEQAEERNLN